MDRHEKYILDLESTERILALVPDKKAQRHFIGCEPCQDLAGLTTGNDALWYDMAIAIAKYHVHEEG